MHRMSLRRNSATIVSCWLLSLDLLLGGAVHGARAQEASPAYRSSEMIVEINPAAGITDSDLNAELGTTTIQQLQPTSSIYLLQTPPGVDPNTLSESLDLDPRILFAEPNFIGHAPEANPRGIGAFGGTDPTPLLLQSAVGQIGLAEALTISRGAGVTVAILDTGVQLDHPAIAGNLRNDGYDFVDGDTVPVDVGGGVDFGHGTHVAGIAHMVAPDAQLLPLRVLRSEGDGDVFHVAQAIDYAVRHGARVINLSLGTDTRSTLLKEAVRDATLAGAMVVAASGNDSIDAPQYPAADSCAIAVTAVGANDTRSVFANYGSWITVAAPGESIFSAFPPNGYAWWSGTSMATPFVAGQIALIRSLRPDLDARAVADIIGGTADSLDALNPTFANLLGDGRIDLPASLRAATAGPIPAARHNRIIGSCVSAGV